MLLACVCLVMMVLGSWFIGYGLFRC